MRRDAVPLRGISTHAAKFAKLRNVRKEDAAPGCQTLRLLVRNWFRGQVSFCAWAGSSALPSSVQLAQM